jgi:opacity protein-like surface antigen
VPLLCTLASLVVVLWLALTGPALAETLPEALVRTYQNNPQLNAERARQRGTDEGVPQALAGYRPQLLATLTGGLQQVRVLFFDNTIQTATLRTWTIGLTVSQTLFNGFKTANTVRQSEAQVLSGREALRNTGQGVLLDAVTAYTNVIANQSLVEAHWMVYATGGFAWSLGRFHQTPGAVDDVDKLLHLHTGWAAGAGAESAIAANWIARLEYLYRNFGHAEVTFPSGTTAGQGRQDPDQILNSLACHHPSLRLNSAQLRERPLFPGGFQREQLLILILILILILMLAGAESGYRSCSCRHSPWFPATSRFRRTRRQT